MVLAASARRGRAGVDAHDDRNDARRASDDACADGSRGRRPHAAAFAGIFSRGRAHARARHRRQHDRVQLAQRRAVVAAARRLRPRWHRPGRHHVQGQHRHVVFVRGLPAPAQPRRFRGDGGAVGTAAHARGAAGDRDRRHPPDDPAGTRVVRAGLGQLLLAARRATGCGAGVPAQRGPGTGRRASDGDQRRDLGAAFRPRSRRRGPSRAGERDARDGHRRGAGDLSRIGAIAGDGLVVASDSALAGRTRPAERAPGDARLALARGAGASRAGNDHRAGTSAVRRRLRLAGRQA